jgi:hypothetical protein
LEPDGARVESRVKLYRYGVSACALAGIEWAATHTTKMVLLLVIVVVVVVIAQNTEVSLCVFWPGRPGCPRSCYSPSSSSPESSSRSRGEVALA